MNVFRATYKDSDGQRKQAARWYIEFRDTEGYRRRFAGFTDKRQTEALGRQVEKLIAIRIAGQEPDRQLHRWIGAYHWLPYRSLANHPGADL